MSKEEQREELHKTIWAMADELRGAIGGWEFKAYVLGTLFYRFINFGADNPVYIFKNANATLPSGVKKDFLPRFTLKLFGFSSTKPNDIAISRKGRCDLIRPSSNVLKFSSYR